MSKKGKQAKEKIISAVLRFMNNYENININSLTVRQIAKSAGVSFSIINYHFQTKDNLIKESIKSSVNRVIDKWIRLEKSLNIIPEEKLRILIKNSGEYYAKHPYVIKMTIFNTFYQEQWDNTSYYFIDHALSPLLHQICPEKSKEHISRVIETVYLAFPTTFLQALAFPDRSSFDFFNKKEREAYADRFVDFLLLALKQK